jgi:dUTP pyrophosphatase
MKSLQIWKLDPRVPTPDFATKQSACFDVSFQAWGKYTYKGYSFANKSFERTLSDGTITINHGDRVAVPTGIILNIPEGHSVRLHPRSGLSLKSGLVLANAEAVIDSDYVDELFILLHNLSHNQITINNGDRIAQAELVESLQYEITVTETKPEQKTDRNGGLGSTGVATVEVEPVFVGTPDEPLPEVKPKGRGRPKKTT